MKTLIVTALLTAAALMAQKPGTPSGNSADPQNSNKTTTTAKKTHRAKKPAKPAASSTTPAAKTPDSGTKK